MAGRTWTVLNVSPTLGARGMGGRAFPGRTRGVPMRRLLVAAISLLMMSAGAAEALVPGDTLPSLTPPLAQTAAPEAIPVTVAGRVWLADGQATLERAGRHWRKVARVTVANHRFSTSANQRSAVARYRLSADGRHSRTFVVDSAAARVGSSAKPTVKPSTSCSTTTITKPDGTPWVCTFDDEFSGTSLDTTKWMPQTNFVSGTSAAYACYTSRPENINVANGSLNLTVRRETSPIGCTNTTYGSTSRYSAGSVMTYHLFSQEYGRFEARVKTTATSAPGLQETFWLWPDDRYDTSGTYWPASGEIDVAETYSQYPTLAIPFLHYTWNDNGGPVPGLNTAWNCTAQRGVYNTYTMTWSAKSIEIDINNVPCLVNTSGDSAFNKRYIMAFSAMLGTGGNALTSSTPLPATTSVDYVRVWQ